MADIYGTIGPACADPEILKAMFREGMTGIRLNTSHVSLKEAESQIAMIHEAAAACGVKAKLLIDMQGPELRLRKFAPFALNVGDCVKLISVESNTSSSADENPNRDFPQIPIPDIVFPALTKNQEVLLDDGKILIRMQDETVGEVIRGGTLIGGKSIALPGAEINPPAMTEQDIRNLQDASEFGVTGVMQPFVRSADDLKQVRACMDSYGCSDIGLLAKIENMTGVENLESFFPYANEIVIARGDLGNALPLWELPRLQKQIEARCKKAGMPFMVVTQMLASMEKNAVPTRAEVSDIYNAVCDGASSVMVTGETAVGAYPVEVIQYLVKTVQSYESSQSIYINEKN